MITDKNEVFGWGNSEYNQLDLSNGIQQINTPIHLQNTRKCGKVIDIASGGSACMVLNGISIYLNIIIFCSSANHHFSSLNFPTEHGDVFVWGFGLIGLGPKADQVGEPTQIPSILLGRNDFSPDSKVCAIHAGFSHFGAVTSTQDLYMWGKNRSACLGLSNEKDQYFPLKVAISAKVEKIDCGVDHTVAYCRPFM